MQYFFGTWDLKKTKLTLYLHGKKNSLIFGSYVAWDFKKSISIDPTEKKLFLARVDSYLKLILIYKTFQDRIDICSGKLFQIYLGH